MKTISNVYIDEESGSYLSVIEGYHLGIDGNYVLHAEGNPRIIYKLWKQYEDEISQGKDVYFLLKKLQYFKNHCSPVEGHEGLYKYNGG